MGAAQNAWHSGRPLLSPGRVVISAHTNPRGCSDGIWCASPSSWLAPPASDDAAAAWRITGRPACQPGPAFRSHPPIVVRTSQTALNRALDVWKAMGYHGGPAGSRPIAVPYQAGLVLSHNTIRGAAGGSLFNAELLVSRADLAPSFISVF